MEVPAVEIILGHSSLTISPTTFYRQGRSELDVRQDLKASSGKKAIETLELINNSPLNIKALRFIFLSGGGDGAHF